MKSYPDESATPTAGRFPLVSKEEILTAHTPITVPRGNSFYTLRAKGLRSSGLRLSLREGNRLQGQIRLFSALNLDCALLARHGREDLARELVAVANQQEKEWQISLTEMLNELGDPQLKSLRLFRQSFAHYWLPLALQVETVRRQIEPLAYLVQETLAIVLQLSDQWASLRLLADPLETVDVHRYLADAAQLFRGDFAVLRSERLVSGSLTILIPAVGDPTDAARLLKRDDDDDAVSRYLSFLREPIELDDASRQELLRREEQGDYIPVPPRTIRLAS